MRKRMLGTSISSLALAVTFGFAGALPVLATPHINEGVCLELDSGKIDTTGDPLSVTVTPPEGMVITGYCVKAGSDNQGDGPVYIDGLSLTTLVIAYPSAKGVPPKAVSHYSVSYGPAPIVPPAKAIIDKQPLAPTFDDQCGYNNDTYIVPVYNPALPYYYVVTASGDGLHVTVQVLPSLGHEFDSTVRTEWSFDFVNNECGPPVTFIVDELPLPTFVDKCGTLNDDVLLQEETEQVSYYYDEVRRAVVAVAKEENGFILQQDIQFEWFNTNTDVPCEVVVPPIVEEEPPVVTPLPAEAIILPAAAIVPASVEVESTEKVEEIEAVVQATSTDVLAETGANPSLLPWGVGLLLAGVMAVLSMSNKFRRLVIKK